MFRTKTQMRQ